MKLWLKSKQTEDVTELCQEANEKYCGFWGEGRSYGICSFKKMRNLLLVGMQTSTATMENSVEIS